MAGELRVSVAVRGGTYTLSVRGEVDLPTEGQFSSLLVQAVDHSERCVEVDLGEVTFLSAGGANRLGLAALAAAHKQVEFRVVRASLAVRHILELFGMTDLLN